MRGVDGWVFEAWGRSRGVFFTGVTRETDFSYSVLVGVVCLGLPESNIKPLHIAYFIFLLMYIYCCFFFLLFFHLKKNANIYCTLSVPFEWSSLVFLFLASWRQDWLVKPIMEVIRVELVCFIEFFFFLSSLYLKLHAYTKPYFNKMFKHMAFHFVSLAMT